MERSSSATRSGDAAMRTRGMDETSNGTGSVPPGPGGPGVSFPMAARPPEEARVAVAGREVSVSVHGEGETAVVLAHGAGGNRRTPLLTTIAEGLAAAGHRVVLTNFPYTEDKRRVP